MEVSYSNRGPTNGTIVRVVRDRVSLTIAFHPKAVVPQVI
jgi:hypothetical protein